MFFKFVVNFHKFHSTAGQVWSLAVPYFVALNWKVSKNESLGRVSDPTVLKSTPHNIEFEVSKWKENLKYIVLGKLVNHLRKYQRKVMQVSEKFSEKFEENLKTTEGCFTTNGWHLGKIWRKFDGNTREIW